jgi:hypothetical protein
LKLSHHLVPSLQRLLLSLDAHTAWNPGLRSHLIETCLGQDCNFSLRVHSIFFGLVFVTMYYTLFSRNRSRLFLQPCDLRTPTVSKYPPSGNNWSGFNASRTSHATADCRSRLKQVSSMSSSHSLRELEYSDVVLQPPGKEPTSRTQAPRSKQIATSNNARCCPTLYHRQQ